MLSGHIPSQHAGPNHLVTLDDCTENAIEVERPRVVLQTQAYGARPVPLLQKTRKSRFYVPAGWFFQEVKKFLSHNVGVGQPHKFADALVDRAQSAVQRYGAGGILEGVNEFLEAAVGARNHVRELVELRLRGSGPHMLLQILKQQFEFAHFLPPAVGIDRQKNR